MAVNLYVKLITDRAEWDAALACLPAAHVLQAWDWGDFKSRWGWQATRLLFEEDGQPRAAAQVLLRRLPRTPFAVTYVPKGPALDVSDTPLLRQVLALLEQQTRQQGSLFVKIDPDVWIGPGSADGPPSPQTAAVLEVLSERGWRPSTEQIQFKNTVIVDLQPDERELLARMKAKTRYNTRLAARHAMQVRLGSQDDLSTFYHLYQATSQRDGFLIRPLSYYLDVWSQFLRAGRAHLLLAEVEREAIAGLILFSFGQSAWYMYGASSHRHKSTMPNYVLQWEAMRLAKRLGCIRYDMWGAPDQFDEGDPMWGVYRFKVGFGGETMRGIGAFDYAPSAWLYWLYTVGMPRALALLRRRGAKKSGSETRL
jgi:lipid II:glycine glycyltransferase (peptidoglycan interpeptide bridge formation enzyme)